MNADIEASPSGTQLTSQHLSSLELPAGILAAASNGSAGQIYTASMDGHIHLVALESEDQTIIGTHQSYASGIVCTSNPHIVISAGYDGLLIWHDTETKRPIHVVKAHNFWSWRLGISPNKKHLASVTGQYRSGGYKYEPAKEAEPSLKVFDTHTGELTHTFSHTPPVTSVAFSPDSRYVAAGNLMGNIKIFDLVENRLSAEWTSPDFTSWGITKSHHYIGGIFSTAFTADGNELLACGMGLMRDPMAGNGKQTWQRFSWRNDTPEKTGEIANNDAGKGLMETLAIDPENNRFVMAGRLAQGQWNTALFDLKTGELLHSLDTKMRTTQALFTEHGTQLILCGATSQKGPKEGNWPNYGRIHRYQLTSA
jgi:WD40 repeat protein